ncbi:peroxiredoxin (alkyl hydroperoxide reductase subunit C) [Pullulanibacillus pueri]|uniref:Peroxiredoxin n=1 Tax=Pullulanibacillus pueri TaxID=1437324 RepID=A0A8J2ZSK2_9BACL|nr:peroxiredoxin [Pullulanibacillus pueri]MBM7680000.1 peroxiredoxin (alkyl hydroperoxide reductase subunit C) [Pullulanibacillus pueri]GGH73869.1 peroxiredoxin [Pullulanibacillus pueri]
MAETEVKVSLPLLNEPAPDFEAQTTQGPLKLSDYRGQYVVLFSHPSDFTPVCTTEFGSFATAASEFEKRNVQLIGLSVDSVPSHLAWIRDIEKIFDTKVKFPVIADLDTKVSRAYGMLHPGYSATATVRSVFIIDDKGILRAMIYYPASAGRSIPEILRVVDSLQTTDASGHTTPADWKPGDPVIVPPSLNANSIEGEEESTAKGLDYKAWYLRYKK